VDEAFKGITHMFQDGALLILKMLLLYIILPEVVGIIILGGILRIRGRMLSFLLTGVAIVGLYLFAIYGLPEMAKADFTK
jgi:hypothetical protein